MKRMLSMALLVAAMLSASMSASANGRRGDWKKGCKGDFRKEIRFHQCNCPRCMEMRRMEAFRAFDRRDPRFCDMRFVHFDQNRRFEARRGDFRKGEFRKGHKHGRRR